MKTIAIIGLGNRGSLYARHLKKHGAKIVALCEKNPELLKNVQKKCDVPEENCFTSDVEFFTKGRLADGIVIATQDRDHYGHCLSAIDLGYDILCEKPVSPIYEQCVEIDRKVKEKGVLMMVCHVLRYSKYFDKIKQIIDSGVIGDVVGVTQIENVGDWHLFYTKSKNAFWSSLVYDDVPKLKAAKFENDILLEFNYYVPQLDLNEPNTSIYQVDKDINIQNMAKLKENWEIQPNINVIREKIPIHKQKPYKKKKSPNIPN